MNIDSDEFLVESGRDLCGCEYKGFLEWLGFFELALWGHHYFAHKSGGVDLLHLHPVNFLKVLLQFWFGQAFVNFENYHIGFYLFGGSWPMQEQLMFEVFILGMLFGVVAIFGDLHEWETTSKP